MKRILLLTILLIGASRSPGAVIYSGLKNIPIPTNFIGVYVDIDNGSFSSSPSFGWDVNFFFGGVGFAASTSFQPARGGTGNEGTVYNYALTDGINGSLHYAGAMETGSGDHLGPGVNQFHNGVEGYLGFKFTKNDNSGPYYGWMRLTLTANTPGGVISDWAWEGAGTAIPVGSVPEPGSMTLLALGAMGAVLRRRRRSVVRRTFGPTFPSPMPISPTHPVWSPTR